MLELIRQCLVWRPPKVNSNVVQKSSSGQNRPTCNLQNEPALMQGRALAPGFVEPSQVEERRTRFGRTNPSGRKLN